jgi:hypothetical protein
MAKDSLELRGGREEDQRRFAISPAKPPNIRFAISPNRHLRPALPALRRRPLPRVLDPARVEVGVRVSRGGCRTIQKLWPLEIHRHRDLELRRRTSLGIKRRGSAAVATVGGDDLCS